MAKSMYRKQQQAEWSGQRQELINALRVSRPGEDRREAMVKVMQWNRALKLSPASGLVLPVTAETIKRSLAAKANKRLMTWRRNQEKKYGPSDCQTGIFLTES